MKRPISQISLLLLFSSLCYWPAMVWAANGNIPDLLGWISQPASSQNVCGGYYQDPLAALINKPLPPLETTAVAIDADNGVFKQAGVTTLTGNVTLTQPGRSVQADRADIYRDPTTGQISNATLTGDVVMREPGKIMVSESGTLAVQSKVAHFFHVLYRILVGRFNAAATTPLDTNQSLNAWGRSSEVEQQPSGIIRLIKATYSTCAPTSNTWQLSASHIDLDRDAGRGYAYNTWLDVDDVPVFYTPYINFPIDNRRQSGFLMPSIGSSTQSGLTISTPYYWNIAPNYDATITPRFFGDRGLQMNSLFRYLTTSSSGSINAGFLPHDWGFSAFKSQTLNSYSQIPLSTTQQAQLNQLENASDNRGFFSWQNKTSFSPRWSGNVNYNYVSDPYYLENFNAPATATPNQLIRAGTINYAGDNWVFTGTLQGYQTLHPINQAAIAEPYMRLPELDLNGNFPTEPYGLHYQWNNQFVYFERDDNPGEDDFVAPRTAPISGGRLNVEPGVSLPLTNASGYVTPNLQVAMTGYNLSNQVPGFTNEITRTLPIFNIDSGLYFDKDVSIWHSDYQQTLEPRVYYLYVPYLNQIDTPIFDTATNAFTYDNLFTTNRFSGLDRIGDADQVAVGLTTRFIDANTGAEKFRASIGQLYYFENRRVTDCEPSGTPGAVSSGSTCNVINLTGPNLLVGQTSPTEVSSPIAGLLSYQFNPQWHTTANMAWDPHSHETMNGSWNFQYLPLPNHVINLNYNFVRLGDPSLAVPPPPTLSHENDLNQIGTSFAWPVHINWNAVGGLDYNRSHAYPQSYFYGLEYDSCCWAVRLVAGRTFSSLNQNGNPVFSNSYYLQWQFKGLATVGSGDPSSMLIGSIPGYQDNFQAFPTFPRLAT